jgi:putative drug exporter of the RND superfamily
VSSRIYRLGRFAAIHPWRVIASWLLLAVTVVAASALVGREPVDNITVPGIDSQRAVDLLDAASLGTAGMTAQVVVTGSDPTRPLATDNAAQRELAGLQTRLARLKKVVTTSDPAGELGRAGKSTPASGTVSPDGRTALITVQYPVLDQLDASDLRALKEVVEAPFESIRVEAGGDLYFQFEQAEPPLGEIVGVIVAIIVLLVAFGSVIAAGLPIATALLGLTIGIGSLGLVGFLIEMPSYATMMAAMVGLGAGIDYALFVVTRHRENMVAGLSIPDSIARSVATAGTAVIFAGGTVMISILGLTIAGLPFITAGGVAIALVVLVMILASVTLLPALLGAVGHRIDRWHVGRKSEAAAPHASRWTTWATHVTRHPVAYTIGAGLLLLALGAPTLALRLGVPDAGTLPETRTERRAYDLAGDAFGPGSNGPLVIAVDVGGDPAVIEPLRTAIAADRGIASVTPAQLDTTGDIAAIVATPRTAPQDAETRATVVRLRTEVFPAVLSGSSARAHVGGQTANFSDLSSRVQDRLPWFIAAVVLTSFLLLTVVFRSVVVPVKAAILNLLSIGAAYGVLVMVFQWEWGGSLIGLEGAVPIVSFIPMLMFAIVFGLSMDYEVFLLSRVREHYDATGDNNGAVVHGLSVTARVITSAALIMVSVFLGFVFGDDPTVKMLGLGLATAIFVDATIVRMVLVPAAMALMGDTNWWLPKRLSRVLPTLDLEGAAHVSATQ